MIKIMIFIFKMLQILASVHYTDEKILRRFIDFVASKQFVPRHERFMTVCMHSVAKLRYRCPALMKQLQNFLAGKMDTKGLYGVTLKGMAWVIADLSMQKDNQQMMMRRIVSLAQMQRRRSRAVHYVHILYFACASKCHIGDVILLLNALLDKLGERFVNLNHDQLCMLRWAQMFCEAWKYEFDWPRELTKLCQEAQKLRTQQEIQNIRGDEFIREVYRYIQSKYRNAELGAFGPGDEIPICILVQSRKFKVAIEPRAYEFLTTNCPNQLIGTEKAKLEVLQQQGYKVLFVSQKLWENNFKYQQAVLNNIQCLLDGKDDEMEEESDNQQLYKEIAGLLDDSHLNTYKLSENEEQESGEELESYLEYLQ
eukprot:TRINITY_DN3076_c0_g1_i1.p1 TRINITY_DN3076_c0_g1~~TRINITY_DN3076_c0_g1_i1.p1  ORF type:complete len:368 (-),score=54.39 TRINITY_DN3076_c0_g1_i1:159-1262(-)